MKIVTKLFKVLEIWNNCDLLSFSSEMLASYAPIFKNLGHKDTVMNKHGIEQVERVSDRLKDENFIKIYSSDLTRAYKVDLT